MTKTQGIANHHVSKGNILLAGLLLGNLILVSIVAYQIGQSAELKDRNSEIQANLTSLDGTVAQLRSNLSELTAQNSHLMASIQTLNLTANSLSMRTNSLQPYLNMENHTTLISNKTVVVWPYVVEGPYKSPNETLVLNFTAEYAGYLVIRSNVTGEVFVTVHSQFPNCDLGQVICETAFSPSIVSTRPTLVPILPGPVFVYLGSNVNFAQVVSIAIEYTT